MARLVLWEAISDGQAEQYAAPPLPLFNCRSGCRFLKHGGLGFRQVACFNQVGYKFGQRIDVIYWQKILGGAA